MVVLLKFSFLWWQICVWTILFGCLNWSVPENGCVRMDVFNDWIWFVGEYSNFLLPFCGSGTCLGLPLLSQSLWSFGVGPEYSNWLFNNWLRFILQGSWLTHNLVVHPAKRWFAFLQISVLLCLFLLVAIRKTFASNPAPPKKTYLSLCGVFDWR